MAASPREPRDASQGPAPERRSRGAIPQPEPQSGRERLLATAYDLFSRSGTRAVGVDRIIAESGVAKMTLYRNFESKDDLIVAFLERREELWTRAWLQAEVEARADTPARCLLAIFDVFGEWFARDGFEGCSFINVMLEYTDPAHPARDASVHHLAQIRAFLSELAGAAGIADADGFARQWHILMKGSIVAAAEGDERAAARAQELGRLLLADRGIAV
jgi:AcrR family transcriptional regulator